MSTETHLQFLVFKVRCEDLLGRRPGQLSVEAGRPPSAGPELEVLAEVDEAVLDAAPPGSAHLGQRLGAGQRQSSNKCNAMH